MKRFGLIIAVLGGILFIYGALYLPDFGDPNSPASQYLSPYYIENSILQTEVPNVVTAVLADYRSYDTMFETTVIFSAGLACFFLLRQFSTKKSSKQFYRHKSTGVIIKVSRGSKKLKNLSHFEMVDSQQWTPYDVIIKTTCKAVLPLVQLFALYVIAHGHHSPGGGFQGGVILGATFILFAIANNLRATIQRFSERLGSLMAVIGVLLYVGTGFFCLALGASFLDYSILSTVFGFTTTMARSHGILVVEIGVGLAVMAIMIWLYYNLSSSGEHDEGL